MRRCGGRRAGGRLCGAQRHREAVEGAGQVAGHLRMQVRPDGAAKQDGDGEALSGGRKSLKRREAHQPPVVDAVDLAKLATNAVANNGAGLTARHKGHLERHATGVRPGRERRRR